MGCLSPLYVQDSAAAIHRRARALIAVLLPAWSTVHLLRAPGHQEQLTLPQSYKQDAGFLFLLGMLLGVVSL